MTCREDRGTAPLAREGGLRPRARPDAKREAAIDPVLLQPIVETLVAANFGLEEGDKVASLQAEA